MYKNFWYWIFKQLQQESKTPSSRNLKTYGCLRLIILAWPACLLSCKYVKVEIAFIDYLFFFKNARNGHNGQPCALKGAFVTQQSVAGDYEREVLHFYANITNSDSTAVIREIVRVSPKMPGSEKNSIDLFLVKRRNCWSWFVQPINDSYLSLDRSSLDHSWPTWGDPGQCGLVLGGQQQHYYNSICINQNPPFQTSF